MHIATHHRAAPTKPAHPTPDANKANVNGEASAEPAPTESVTISYLPQDTGMIPVQQGKVDEPLQAGPSGPRLRVSVPRNFPQAAPDKDGNFLFKPDDPNFDSVNTYFVAHQTLKVAEQYAGREIPWSFSQELGREQMLIHPHAGAGVVNAYYTSEGGSINFFSYKNDDKDVHRTGLQSDVVAHEAGHAILDALRPTYIRTLAVPAGGFHESFGDMIAMLRALHEPSIIAALKQETSGDLSRSNVVSRVAEQLGQDAFGTNYLRDAVNDHKFADQHFLPYIDREHRNAEGKPDGNSFGTEPHAYATLFTGAFYDLFGALYENAAQDPDVSFSDAVASARDQAGQLLFRAIELSPVGNPAYPEMAEAFLQADAIDNNGALRPFIEAAFRDRNIINDENIANLEARIQEMPKVKLPAEATEEKGALAFLKDKREALGLPSGVDFKFESTYTNKAGETFLTFSTKREGMLDDPDFGTNEGAKFEGVGGLVLGFDAKNKLFVKNYDEITDREMSDIKNHVRSLAISGNLISGAVDGHQHDPKAREKVHVVLVNDGNGPVLRKAPVLFC
jgi:hypothetical protein